MLQANIVNGWELSCYICWFMYMQSSLRIETFFSDLRLTGSTQESVQAIYNYPGRRAGQNIKSKQQVSQKAIENRTHQLYTWYSHVKMNRNHKNDTRERITIAAILHWSLSYQKPRSVDSSHWRVRVTPDTIDAHAQWGCCYPTSIRIQLHISWGRFA